MGESMSTIQRSPRISTSYKFAAPRYRLPPMALQTVQVSVKPRLSKIAQSCRTVVPKTLPVSAPCTTFPTALSLYMRRDACERISAIQAVLKGRTAAIRKGNTHQLGLFFLLEACQRNAAGWSTAGWPANAKLPLCHRHSVKHSTLLLERSSAKLLVFACTRALDRLRMRRRVGSARRRGNHMHDHSRFQRDIHDVTSVSLSLSLLGSALPNNRGFGHGWFGIFWLCQQQVTAFPWQKTMMLYFSQEKVHQNIKIAAETSGARGPGKQHGA